MQVINKLINMEAMPQNIKNIKGEVWRYVIANMYYKVNSLNQHSFGSIIGPPGSGKSYLSLYIAYILNPEFTMDYVAFDNNEYFDLCERIDKVGVPIIYEEIEIDTNAKEHMKKEVLDTAKLMGMIRSKNIHHIWNCPSENNIPSDIRRNRQYNIVCEERNTKAPTKFVYTYLKYPQLSRDSGNNKYAELQRQCPGQRVILNKTFGFVKLKTINKFTFKLPRDDPVFMELVKQYEKKKKQFSIDTIKRLKESSAVKNEMSEEDYFYHVFDKIETHKANFVYPGTKEYDILKIIKEFGVNTTKARFIISELKKKNKAIDTAVEVKKPKRTYKSQMEDLIERYG